MSSRWRQCSATASSPHQPIESGRESVFVSKSSTLVVKLVDMTVRMPDAVKHARKRPFGATAIFVTWLESRSCSNWSSGPFASTTTTDCSFVPRIASATRDKDTARAARQQRRPADHGRWSDRYCRDASWCEATRS